LYSYLGSAAEVDPAMMPFEVRRRRAATELLAGYAELLAQELPKKAPELPAVHKIGGEEFKPNSKQADRARARHAAQMAARRQAEFIRALVERRNILADQLRWLYRPHPKVYGRGPDGPEKLRALAARMLQDPAAVKALLAHVTAP
jgi:hypothetical protein